jgi:HlyD family secretion protein
MMSAREMGAAIMVTLAMLVIACGSSDDGRESTAALAMAAKTPPKRVTALGRIEPRDGIIRVSGPARPSVVIGKLHVEEGDRVQEGQPLAELDSTTTDQANVAKATAALKNAQKEIARIRPLVQQRVAAEDALDDAQMRVDIAQAELAAAQAQLDLDVVRAPVSGQVVSIHTRRGERVGPDGLAEIARNDEMFAVAEVYETDIRWVKVGQPATVRSPAFKSDLTGKVDRVGLKIGKQDLIETDPVARTDARVVEVHVKLDDSAKAAGLSNLQVEVLIEPGA